MSRKQRFSSRKEALLSVGLLYMLSERVFFILSLLSLLNIRTYIARKALGSKTPKTSLIHKDSFKLIYFFLAGLLSPLYCVLYSPPFSSNVQLLIGIYIVLLSFGHHVNVVMFDSFRWDRLPMKESRFKIYKLLYNVTSIVLPPDKRLPSSEPQNYVLSGARRRLVIAVADFWLLYFGFSVIYWSKFSTFFQPAFLSFSHSLYYSVVAGTTLGFGDIHPTELTTKYITIFQTMMCFLFGLIIIAYALALLPKPKHIEE